MDKIYMEIIYLEIKYSSLSKENRAQITFPQYVALRYLSWREEEALHWIILVEEKRVRNARWWEEQRNPTPIKRTQLCYSFKVPWEPDHRCRGKDQKHIIEAHYDSDDEVCEDGAINVDLGKSDDDSDSCIEASDSDSCTEAGDSGMLEEDSDPCTLEEQWDGQEDSTYASEIISHTVDDFTPQQSGDTSEDSHVLALRSDEFPMMVVTRLSSFQTPLIATSHEDMSGRSDMIEEPCVREAHHEHVDP
jgi:hypothetical protein